jgi:hypothetical protein
LLSPYFFFLPFALPNTEAAILLADLVLLGFFRTLDAALASFLDVFLHLAILTSYNLTNIKCSFELSLYPTFSLVFYYKFIKSLKCLRDFGLNNLATTVLAVATIRNARVCNTWVGDYMCVCTFWI